MQSHWVLSAKIYCRTSQWHMMDGVSWSTSRDPEAFKRQKMASDTLNRLASFIARAESKQSLRSHKQQPLPFACQECGESFPYATELLQHQEVQHTLPKPHRCPSCGTEFSLRSSLQLHKCEDPSPRQLCHEETCDGPSYVTCLNKAADADRTKDSSPHCEPHMLDSSAYTCAPCGKGFKQKQALLHHQQAGCSKPVSPPCTSNVSSPQGDSPHVSSPSNSLDDAKLSSKTENVCAFCSRTFRTEAAFQRHTQTSHSDERQTDPGSLYGKRESASKEAKKGADGKSNKFFSCRSCEMVFRSTAKLYVHRKEKHSRETKIRTEPRPAQVKHRKGSAYICQICSKVFFHHLSLWAHTRKHPVSTVAGIKNKGMPPKCSTKECKSIEKPNATIKFVTNKKPVKEGPWPRNMPAEESHCESARHKKVPDVEEEELEFPCPSCPEVFSLHSQLKKHVELHQSAIRRSQCSVCTNEMDTCKGPGSKRQRLYHCVPCQQGFSSLDSFLIHCQDHLRIKVEEDSISEGATRRVSEA